MTLFRPAALGLGWRIGVIGLVLTVETVALSYLIQATFIAPTGIADTVHEIQHWLFRFVIAYAASLAMMIYAGHEGRLKAISAAAAGAPVRVGWWIVHGVLLAPLALLSASLYGNLLPAPFLLIAFAWHACAVAVGIALFLAMAPLPVWTKALRESGNLALFAAAPALAAVLAIRWLQMLWVPAARLTFHIAEILLRPVRPDLFADPATLTLGTDRFAVTVAEVCSGLEGVGLMFAFCAAWLWYFRREYYFPRALIIVPLAMVLVFLLNAVRIAALVLIGDAGYSRVAIVGFHSQAGWIAFNLAAFTIAIIAKHSRWINRTAGEEKPARTDNPTAPYLVPLLAILAAGMLAHALSGGFDLLYPLRLIAAGAALWAYRRRYRALDWGFSWRAVAVGILLFVVWIGLARWFQEPATTAQGLSQLPAPARIAWLASRVLAMILTVPIAEELAYRGYLMRRFAGADFDAIKFRDVRWPALVLAAIVSGVTHGSMWMAGTVAGLAYGLLAIRTNRLGEAVAAHATTNALIALSMLVFDQSPLW